MHLRARAGVVNDEMNRFLSEPRSGIGMRPAGENRCCACGRRTSRSGVEDTFSGSISALRRICFRIIQVPLIPNITRHPAHIFPSRHGFQRTLHGWETAARASVLASKRRMERATTRRQLAPTRFPPRSYIQKGAVATRGASEPTQNRRRRNYRTACA